MKRMPVSNVDGLIVRPSGPWVEGSGPGARPMKPEWVYSVREQCRTYGVKFFFKQWGTYAPDGERVGKKAAGRKLDGKTWDEMPEVAASRQGFLWQSA